MITPCLPRPGLPRAPWLSGLELEQIRRGHSLIHQCCMRQDNVRPGSEALLALCACSLFPKRGWAALLCSALLWGRGHLLFLHLLLSVHADPCGCCFPCSLPFVLLVVSREGLSRTGAACLEPRDPLGPADSINEQLELSLAGKVLGDAGG